MTYPELKILIADWLNRTDLAPSIPVFIQLAETELNRKLRTSDMESSYSLSISSDSHSLPSDFLEPIEAYIIDQSGRTRPLQFLSPLQFFKHQETHPTSGVPSVATVRGSTLYVSPSPSGTFDGSLLYYQQIPQLSDSNTTNWLIQKHPDLYLYASLAHSAPFLRDDDRIAVWAGKMDAILREIHLANENKKYGPSNMAASPGLIW